MCKQEIVTEKNEYCVPCKGVIHLWGFLDFKVVFSQCV